MATVLAYISVLIYQTTTQLHLPGLLVTGGSSGLREHLPSMNLVASCFFEVLAQQCGRAEQIVLGNRLQNFEVFERMFAAWLAVLGLPIFDEAPQPVHASNRLCDEAVAGPARNGFVKIAVGLE